MRTPFTIIAILIVALLGLWALTSEEEGAATAPAAAPVDVIAHRVEGLRSLRFTRLPTPVTVTPQQAVQEGLADFDRQYPPERRRADEEIYRRLGLLEPGDDLREVSRSLFGEGVAGYYDPRDGRLRVVEGSGTGTRVLEEMVLAHELTHALEDQRFGLPTETAATDDRELARAALHEGSATSLMYSYVEEHFTAEEALGGLLGSAFQGTGDLPPFLQAQLLFAYVGGERFVADLRRRGGGSWALVDTAFRLRPPSSTEQVLHPRAYISADAPQRVRLRTGAVLGPGWSRARAGTWGELQTRGLVGSRDAATGWGGDRYELWRSGSESALIMRWRWDTARDEAQFAWRLREWARKLDGAVVARRGGSVTLALAPGAGLAGRLAGA
ncbi:MAG TPA: hypothetical protein VHJ39_00915 [Solirubrobacteraceae bacterium]|jgi:hypothetical protein|nr:hypothetical protein [Solirubrobacteraceae bacterium]